MSSLPQISVFHTTVNFHKYHKVNPLIIFGQRMIQKYYSWRLSPWYNVGREVNRVGGTKGIPGLVNSDLPNLPYTSVGWKISNLLLYSVIWGQKNAKLLLYSVTLFYFKIKKVIVLFSHNKESTTADLFIKKVLKYNLWGQELTLPQHQA